MTRARAFLVWAALALAVALPLAVAADSPLLQWRRPVYIAAGFAGIAAMAVLLVQPLLAGGYLPGLPAGRGRRVHRVTGALLVAAVAVHVAGLWITSPPDMIDALTFTAPTAFSVFGVVSMWLLLAAAALAVLRRRLAPRAWRAGHTAAVTLAVLAAVVHALLIEGTMGTASKTALCLLALAATARVMADLRVWRSLRRRRA